MIVIDVHEPAVAEEYFGRSTPHQRKAINEEGWADYKWTDVQGTAVHVERKQWAEIMGMDKVEDQLRRHLSNKPEARLVLLIEGLLVPTAQGVALYGSTSRDAWVPKRESKLRIPTIYAWLYQIGKFCEVYNTSDYRATIMALSSFYWGDQRDDHTTLHRYMKSLTFNPNPQVSMLIGMLPGIGEERGKALINKFVTVWNAVNASPEEWAEVPGIGKKLSVEFLRRIGRTDI